ncbi:hypothetical protein [Myxococcus phage Mx1]|nr:hypothetical protein [Myxococcus phage Mx1]
MARAKKAKDPYASLPDDFKSAVGLASPEELKAKLAEVAKSQEANLSSMKADPDLNKLKEQVKFAGAGYSEVTKTNRQKTKFIIRALADKGDPVAQAIIQNDIEAELQKS